MNYRTLAVEMARSEWGAVTGVITPTRRTTLVIPIRASERRKARAGLDLTATVPTLRALAHKIDRLAVQSNASWETIVASQVMRDAVAAFEAAVTVDERIAP